MADFTIKTTKNTTNSKKSRCPVSKKCGGCTMIDVPYAEQAERKQQLVEELIGEFGRVDPIIRMKNPDHYRNKVTSVFAPDKKGKPVCGIYKAGTHEVVPVKSCMLEDLRADRIIQTVFALMESFKIRVYDEDRGTGFLRYVQVRTARGTRQVMVTLVTAEAVFPPAKKFVNALIKRHPEITTVVQNINDKHTTMVLGDREKVLFGPGYIEDVLCKKRFRISSRSFYQVNSLQTEKLYNIALDYAGFSGKERILDAYCGIGTIGIIASDRCKEVLSVELNAEARNLMALTTWKFTRTTPAASWRTWPPGKRSSTSSSWIRPGAAPARNSCALRCSLAPPGSSMYPASPRHWLGTSIF